MTGKRRELYETEEDQVKFLRKKGNVITFKDPIYPWGKANESRKQILVHSLKRDFSGAAKIVGQFYDTPWYKNIKELLKAVDWGWMRNVHQSLPKRAGRRKGRGI